jgi:hypothetical protein
LGILVVAGLLVLVGGSVYWGARIGLTAWQAYDTGRSAAAQFRAAAWSTLPATTGQLAGQVATLQAEVQPLAPVLRQLTPLPGYGPTLAAVPELLLAARQAVDLGGYALRAAGPALQQTEGKPPLERFVAAAATLDTAGPELASRVAELKQSLARLPVAALPQDLAAAVDSAVPLLDLAAVGARLGPQWSWLLGMDSPRTYLVAVQNNHELRATGGFISALGTVTVDRGRIVVVDLVDSYEIFREDASYPPAPAPMADHMGIRLLVPRDANWWPNFPTSAQTLRTLYTRDTGRAVDGVIALDMNAVRGLVGALGALTVSDAPEPITADNIEEQMIRFWEQPLGTDPATLTGADWWLQRKDFVATIAAAALARLQSGSVDATALAGALQTALDGRALQIWLNAPDAQAVVANAHWDGSLYHEAGQDFLAVVDTNMGYNKANAAVERALAYRVAWPEGFDQPPTATVEITYSHTAAGEDTECAPQPRYGATYADLIARCYFNYLRVYAPAGSTLVDATGVELEQVGSRRGEAGTQEFSTYFVVAPGAQRTVTLSYRLPAAVAPEDYRLLVLRQAGTAPLPVELDIDGERTTTTLTGGRLVWPLESPSPQPSAGIRSSSAVAVRNPSAPPIAPILYAAK